MPTARVIIVSGGQALLITRKSRWDGDVGRRNYYSGHQNEETAVAEFLNEARRRGADNHFSWGPYNGNQPPTAGGGGRSYWKAKMLVPNDVAPQPPGGEYTNEPALDAIVRELGEEIGVTIDPGFFHPAGNHRGIDYFTMTVEDVPATRDRFLNNLRALDRGTEIYAASWRNPGGIGPIYGQNVPGNVVTAGDIQDSHQVTIMRAVIAAQGQGGNVVQAAAPAQRVQAYVPPHRRRPGGKRRSTRRRPRRALRKTRKAYI